MVTAARSGGPAGEPLAEAPTLDIVVAQDLSVVSMRGPAETVFCGEVETSTIMALDGPAE